MRTQEIIVPTAIRIATKARIASEALRDHLNTVSQNASKFFISFSPILENIRFAVPKVNPPGGASRA